MQTYAFIDASNIIYGARGERWKVDFKKLFKYLKERYECKKIYYFAGKDSQNIKQLHFYKKLQRFGYDLVLKQIKFYKQENDHIVRKANCDVDLTFYAMKHKEKFERAIFLTGDGDFFILLNYLLNQKKKISVIANGKRTAKEIRVLMGSNFIPIKSLKKILIYKKG